MITLGPLHQLRVVVDKSGGVGVRRQDRGLAAGQGGPCRGAAEGGREGGAGGGKLGGTRGPC
eukprot:scaffold31417_cov90-Isochrysis_galbana.AAC.1